MNFPPVDGQSLFPLEEIIDRSPIIVSPDTSLQEVFLLMKQSKEVGKEADCVLIATGDKLAGIFTIREAVDFFAQGMQGMNLPISAVMNSQMATLTLSETSVTLEELNYFCRLEIAYLPVISTEEKLVGLLTLKKLSAYLPSFMTECGLQGQFNRELEVNLSQRNQELAKALQKVEMYAERLTLALEGANVGLWDWDITTNQVYWTPQHESIFGYETGNPNRTYDDWRNRVHPDDIGRVEAEINSLSPDKTEYSFEYRIIWPDGSIHWIEGLGRFSFDENGQGIRAIGIVYDITERVLVEQSLRESEARLKTIFDSNFFGVAYGDVDGKITGGNDEYLRIIGHSRKDLGSLSLSCHDITPPEYLSLDSEKLAEVVNQGACNPYEKEYIRPDGTRVPVLLGYGLVAQEKREMLGFVLDLSPVKAAEKSLHESEERFKALFNANVIGLAIGDVSGGIKEGNDEYLRIIGYEKEAIGAEKLRWTEITDPEYLGKDMQGIAEAQDRGACTPYEKEFIRPDGTRVSALIGYGLVGETKEEIVCFILDLSAIKNAERQMQRLNDALTESSQLLAKRNQELERFAYVVSHDLKAPLRAIANLSEWLEEDLEPYLTDENHHNMQLLRQRVYRLNAMIEGLLDYSRIGLISVPQETVNVAELIQEIIDALAVPPEFTIKILADLPTFFAKRLFLSQIFSNLISNAIKHHESMTGRIEIQAVDRGDYYEFSVKDDGPGIAPEYQEKIFDIFQILAARDQTENTGVGLSIVKKIIDNQGERIWLNSKEGEGATFYFTWHKKSPNP
jgi:PAS domain S-box-containing protein